MPRQAQPERIGANEALPLTALISPQPIKGVGVANGNFHGPAVAILVDAVVGASRPIRGKKGFEGWGRFSWPGLFGGGLALTPQPHHPHEAPRHHRVPQAIPGLALGARFAGVRCPSRGGLRHGLRRADQVAFFGRGAATLLRQLGWQRVELGADRQPPDDVGCLGQLTALIPRGIATVSQASDGMPGHLLGHESEDSTGSLPAGTIRPVELVGWRWLARQCKANRDTAAVARPPCERHTHHAQNAV